MKIARSVADVLRDHVVLEYEAIDRMYLNVYVPHLQTVGATVGYLRVHHGQRFASTTAVAPMTDAFVRNIEEFVAAEDIDLIAFQKNQRKDEVTQKRIRKFKKSEGVLYVGKAQEKARVMRTERRRCSRTGATYPWIVESTAMVNHYYFYCVDEDFGPFFLKFCSYFPYNGKLCINGHEYLKRQLAKRGVAFEALDNGIKSCANPQLLQRLADGLTAEKIDRLLRKWLRRLPHPFPPRDRAAGYRYQLSILQAEFSLTQVLDQPVTGRIFFEEVIRENLDIGRPSQVSLVFDRKINRRTPGQFRTRVITDGVVPSLHIYYKKSRIKQYHKLLEALRTETTINDTRDFGIGRRLENLAELRKIGFAANRRLLDVQRIGHDCFIGEAAFQDMQRPVTVGEQRAAALRFADPRVQGLLHVLLLFVLVQGTFRNKDLREHIAPLLGIKPSQLTPGRVTYDLRRLRLHGLIERIPKTHCYRITAKGLRTAVFYTRLYNRSLRTGLAVISPDAANANLPLARSIRAAEAALNIWYDKANLAA
jgi:DNA-binding HxlR family transcriptional regulator